MLSGATPCLSGHRELRVWFCAARAFYISCDSHFIHFILMFWMLDQEAPEAEGLLSLWAEREEENDSNGEEERQNPASPGGA